MKNLRLVAAIITVCALLASGIGPVLARSSDGATAKQRPTSSPMTVGPPILGGGGLQPTALIKAHGETPTNSNEPLASGVSFSLDGQLVVTGGADHLVRLRRVPKGEPAATLKGHISPVAAVAVNPVTGVVASAGEDRTIRLWDTSDAKPLGVILTQHTARITTMAVSPTGKYLATGAEDFDRTRFRRSDRCDRPCCSGPRKVALLDRLQPG